MKLRKYGFFKELPYGDSEGGSVTSLRGTSGYDSTTKQCIVTHLLNGVVLVGCPGVVSDVFSKEHNPIGYSNILTDGEWAWPEDLAYYVSKYDVPIPREMIEVMSKRGWRITDVFDLENLEL